MILAYLLLLTGLTISSVAIYYSVVGLTAIFSAAATPIMIMGVSLEVAKLVCATWIKQHWSRVPFLMKTYMVTAVTVLMLITSMGIFGFLSKAHNDQNLVSGDVQSKIAVYDEKIKTAKENIDANRKALKQMDEAVDQVMGRSQDEKGADKAVAIRRGQAKERTRLLSEITAEQKLIAQLSEERAPIAAEVRKVEAEVGPIKYIAAFIYDSAPDANMLEKAVTWIIILIVVVFDPLAVIMLLASQMTFGWQRKEEDKPVEEEVPIETPADPLPPEPEYEADEGPLTEEQIEQLKKSINDFVPQPQEYIPDEPIACHKCGTELEDVPGIGLYCPNKDCTDPELVEAEEPEVVEEPIEPAPMPEPTSDSPERPGDYIEPPAEVEAQHGQIQPETAIPRKVVQEPVPEFKPNNKQFAPVADNSDADGNLVNSGFGTSFPPNPDKGDMFLRVDFLPSRLFKWNDKQWIEIDKELTDSYTYDDSYIEHLIAKVDAGEYDVDMLNDSERAHIQDYLFKKANNG